MKSLKSKLQAETPAKMAGKAISQARIKRDLTQHEMGLLMTTTRQYICDIERGEANITLKTLGEIAERLGCKVEIKLRKIRVKKSVGSQNAMPVS